MSADLAAVCQKFLSAEGRLAEAIPDFCAREQQIQLSSAIAQAILTHGILVAEAGTGTGKTFAYLIPCLLSGKKAVISTATKTLQDQLFHKDLPMLLEALGLGMKVQNLKGRANYICLHRTKLHGEEGSFTTPQCAHEIAHINAKLPQLTQGERSELPEINEDSPVWPYVTSTRDNCLGTECAFFNECFLVKARKRALEANLVIINHHLFFADSQLKTEGFGELLPGVEVVIFDEAHQLAEIAMSFYGVRINTRQLEELMDDILREWPVLEVPEALRELQNDLIVLTAKLKQAISVNIERHSWHKVWARAEFQAAWQSLLVWGEALANYFPEQIEQTGLARCAERLRQIRENLTCLTRVDKHYIPWLETFKQSVVFHATPCEISDVFGELLPQERAHIFTSATLTMAGNFDCFTKPLGLSAVETLTLPSPFDYSKQALLYLPRDLPDPKDLTYYPRLVNKALPIIEANGGRCFFLFTSHRALKQVAELLRNQLNLPLLIQGDEAKPILLARFRALGNAVLLGTATFWEGVDVKGETLSCVIIDKLPFASPADPIMQGRIAYINAQGLSSFDELSLPQAVLALKQGVGRLIRDETDTGVLMIADPRLTGRAYGQRILASLPTLKKTRDAQRVFNFIRNL